ncbi:MAG: four-helix bundle copper-binding protein [Deltaproteobacteria bacterium]|nr:four-helix bundle copper-binding protein [Deltaproteobacteria bacterium]
MSTVGKMIETHPRKPAKDLDAIVSCVEECFRCADTCTVCADACLGEPEMLSKLVRCIRLNLDCSEVCATTGRLLAVQTERDPELTRAQLQACAAACRICAAECEKHAAMHEHCRVCAEECRRCEESCKKVLAL